MAQTKKAKNGAPADIADGDRPVVSDVTITRADGTTEVQPAYDSDTLARIIGEGNDRMKKKPSYRRRLEQA